MQYNIDMQILENVSLSDYTSFGTGGKADKLIIVEETNELVKALNTCETPIWFLGSGANVLISDNGLNGTVIHLDTNNIKIEGNLFIADGGVNWDDLVQKTIEAGLWGLERTSGIPGSVGAAVVGNIAAYGQDVSDTLVWVEVLNVSEKNPVVKRIPANELDLSYRYSRFQSDELEGLIIVSAAFELQTKGKPLEYAKAMQVAKELELDPEDLKQRRQIIMEARKRAGSLLEPGTKTKTAGSFFRNPEVSEEIATMINSFDENKKSSQEDIKKQNQIHGGTTLRVSAANVLLAAGFKRGQTWGPVRLHPDHILKIENTGGATSQQIYDVQKEIVMTVNQKLGITLIPEPRLLGKFN